MYIDISHTGTEAVVVNPFDPSLQPQVLNHSKRNLLYGFLDLSILPHHFISMKSMTLLAYNKLPVITYNCCHLACLTCKSTELSFAQRIQFK